MANSHHSEVARPCAVITDTPSADHDRSPPTDADLAEMAEGDAATLARCASMAENVRRTLDEVVDAQQLLRGAAHGLASGRILSEQLDAVINASLEDAFTVLLMSLRGIHGEALKRALVRSGFAAEQSSTDTDPDEEPDDTAPVEAETRLRKLLHDLDAPLGQIENGMDALMFLGDSGGQLAHAVDFVTDALRGPVGNLQELWRAEWARTMRAPATGRAAE